MRRQIVLCILTTLTVTALAAGAQPAASQPTITVVDLGTLGGTTSAAYDINNLGQVVGDSRTASGESHAFLWTAENGMQDLDPGGGGASYASAINDGGQVAGYKEVGGYPRAILWPGDGSTAYLGTLYGGEVSGAADLNEQGVVVGQGTRSQDYGGGQYGFRWTSGSGMEDLGGLAHTAALAVNSQGKIVGKSTFIVDDSYYVEHAVLWQAGDMLELGSLGLPRTRSVATGINDKTQVVGYSETVLNEWHIFLWQAPDGPMRDLGSAGLPLEVDINDQGQVVGYEKVIGESGNTEYRSFLWTQADGMRDLGALGGLGGDNAVMAINDEGQAVGWCDFGDGERRACLWQLEPTPGQERLIVSVASPVDLFVTDPLGRAIGRSPGGEIVNEIPDATYSGPDPDTLPEEIVIPEPEDGVYLIQLLPTGSGLYTLTVRWEMGDETVVRQDSGQVEPDNDMGYTFDVRPDSDVILNGVPDCSMAAPSRAQLWPPHHNFEAVEILGITDPEGDPLSLTVTGIYQDEPVDTEGDGSHVPDGQGVGTATAELRAERQAGGNGRAYHISFSADDGHGGICSGEVLVGVPHDVEHDTVDDGALYDSTATNR